jgi:DNA-binding CsgD family transcriptional regulator
MYMGGIKPGDLLECDVRGQTFYARAVTKPVNQGNRRVIELEPLHSNDGRVKLLDKQLCHRPPDHRALQQKKGITLTDRPKLAKKQKRVLDLLVRGKTPTQAAKAMKISVNGIYGHMRRIEEKGYEVPRSRSTAKKAVATPKKPKRRTAPTNSSGPVSQIDTEIAKLEVTIRERQKEIGRETLEIKRQTEALHERTDALLAETDALGQRQNALAAASA